LQDVKNAIAGRNQAMKRVLKHLDADRVVAAKELAFLAGYKETSIDTILRVCKKAKELGYVKIIGKGTKINPLKMLIKRNTTSLKLVGCTVS